MTVRVVGAGVGRTGTMSLKAALEQLVGGPCYHGSEVFTRPDHLDLWSRAARGETVDWHSLFDGFEATVDWPASAFWEEISAAFPDAIVLLSTRESAASWFRSAHETIFRYAPLAGVNPAVKMFSDVMAARFTANTHDADEACAAYERHNAHVRATVPSDRLVEWTPRDGWGPLCAALDVPVPDEPFPRVNTKDDWDEMADVDALAAAQGEFADVIHRLEPHVQSGTPTDDPRVRSLVGRWEALGDAIDGGDERRRDQTKATLREHCDVIAGLVSRSPQQVEAVFDYLDSAEGSTAGG